MTACTLMCKASSSPPPHLRFGYALVYVFQLQAQASILGERESAKPHALAVTDGTQGTDNNPKSVGTLR